MLSKSLLMASALPLALAGGLYRSELGSLYKRQNIPDCVYTCLEGAAITAYCNSLQDATCLCESGDFVIAGAECFATSCTPQEAAIGAALGTELCQAVGVPFTFPEEANSILATVTGTGPYTGSFEATSTSSGVRSTASVAASSIASDISESSVASETAQPTAAPASAPDSSASQLTGGALSLLAVAGLAMIL